MSKGLRLISFLCCIVASLQASQEGANPFGGAAQAVMEVDAQGHLDLSGRNLSELPRIWNMPGYDRIKTINLSNNELTNESLRADWFPGTVTHVVLSHNRLESFPAGVINQLPESVKFIDLSHNQINSIGGDITVGQRGLKIDLEGNHLSEQDLSTIAARLVQVSNSTGLTWRQRLVQRLTSPCGRMTKLVGGVALFAGYELLKNACDVDSQSPVARVAKIVQNGLYVAGGLHTLYNTYYAKHKLVEENPEIALGVAGLFVVATPGIIHDTKMLALGSDASTGALESMYANSVYSGMRAAGTVYAAGECVAWLKNRWARSMKTSIEQGKNGLVAH